MLSLGQGREPAPSGAFLVTEVLVYEKVGKCSISSDADLDLSVVVKTKQSQKCWFYGLIPLYVPLEAEVVLAPSCKVFCALVI